MKTYEEAYLIKSSADYHGTEGMFLTVNRGFRWTEAKSRALGFLNLTKALIAAREAGLNETQFSVDWHRIEVDVPRPTRITHNITAETVKIQKAKVFRADGRIEEI